MGFTGPVVLCGCKSDLAAEADEQLQRVSLFAARLVTVLCHCPFSPACWILNHGDLQAIIPIMRRFPQTDSCVECSAKKLIYTSEVFAYAVKSVLNPVAPLYDPHVDEGRGALKPACIKALRRVFIICDKDKVGIQRTSSGCTNALCWSRFMSGPGPFVWQIAEWQPAE